MILPTVLVLVGLVVLTRGADVFVVAASRLAVTLKLSPIVIGAVVVGFGTGMPELIVSGSAAARGNLDIALGNVVGSNLANLTLVLGVAGVLARPEIVPRVLRREAPLSVACVALLALLIQNGLDRREAIVLAAALIVSLVVMLRVAKPDTSPDDIDDREAEENLIDEVEEFVEEEGEDSLEDVERASTTRDVVRTVLGLLATVAGAQVLVAGAQTIAADLGLSGGFVGLTLVAVGTSLPELVTAIQSARRDETALLVGNVLGSNVFNSTAVAGAAAAIGPATIADRGLTFVAAGSMVVVAVLTWLFLWLGRRLRAWEAVVLLVLYVATIPLSL